MTALERKVAKVLRSACCVDGEPWHIHPDARDAEQARSIVALVLAEAAKVAGEVYCCVCGGAVIYEPTVCEDCSMIDDQGGDVDPHQHSPSERILALRDKDPT